MQPAIKKTKEVDQIISENIESYLASRRVISIPFHLWLKRSEMNLILEKIQKYHSR